MMIAGLTPRAIVEPKTVDELAACVGSLYARDTAFAFAGGGTELELGNPPCALDTLVRTTACNRVIDYAPQDQTITVEAGMTVAEVTAVLARERQFIAIDTPDAERTTIGGAIATNVYGGRRLRYGSIKDTIVGIEIVRPDGTRARGGGKVVKNVAGFDMPKLMVGSLGTLGAIVGATFRVYPLEEQRATFVYRNLGVEQLMNVCRELMGEALVPDAVIAVRSPAGGQEDQYDCNVLFAGFARGVEQQMGMAGMIASRLGLSGEALTEAAVAALRESERVVRRDPTWRVTVSARPTELARFLAVTPLAAGLHQVVYPLLGTAFIAGETLDAITIERWRGMLDRGTVVINAMPLDARKALETWGEPPPASLNIMRRLKMNFDPKGLCNAGRFIGGL